MLKAKLLVGMVLLLVPPAALGTSLRVIDPLGDVEMGGVEIRFGDALRIDDPKAKGLFAGDKGGAEKFAAEAQAKLETLLTERGIRIGPDWDHGIVIGIYGGHSPKRDCDGMNVFSVQATAWRPDPESGEATEGYSRGFLGAAKTEELADQLMKVIDEVASDIRSRRHE